MIYIQSARRVLLLAPLVFLVSCSRYRSADLPEEMEEHMAFADFLSLAVSGTVYVLAFDQSGDSSPDYWEHWDLIMDPPLRKAMIDKNNDGTVDTWSYFENTNRPYLIQDADFDGAPDRWVYHDGRRAYDTDGDGEPDKHEPPQ